jgi:predicted enzyme related to lactoylglutathione lyase
MPARDPGPLGAPCWTDLWTSDVEGSRSFYTALFGWEALAPSPELEGYFMFARDGVPVAGAMGDMGGAPANDTWKIYLATDDVATTVRAAEAGGAQVVLPATPVADPGVQAVLVDPTGAHFGAWQTGTFPGFTVWEEHGTPSWFELYTRDLDAAATFYATVFRMEITAVADSGDFRYSTLRHPGDERELAGIMDASAVLPDGVAAHWTTYWEVDDVDATSARVAALGGSVLTEPADSPYGRMATVTDPCGTTFRLRTA